ncbi:hypothetical protein BGX26_011321 [Mortierella sp. AD094]|nr:hypothetical protein BGX26_011321 [Mortierella sp. AD094]
MDAFIDWMTNPENYQRLTNPNPNPGRKKPKTLHQEIADYVNGIHDAGWNRNTAKAKLLYARKKYFEARDLDHGSIYKSKIVLRKHILSICPDYDRFKAVFDDLPNNSPLPPPSPKQSIPKQSVSKQSGLNLDDDSESPNNDNHSDDSKSPNNDNNSDASDNEDGFADYSAEDHCDQQEQEQHEQQEQYHDDYQLNHNHRALSEEIESSDDEPLLKRRRLNEPKTPQHAVSKFMAESSNAVLAGPSTRVLATEFSTRDVEEAMRYLRQRELVIDERENESYRRMAEKERDSYWRISENEKASYQRIGDNERESHRRISENERNHQETLDRRMREFMEEKAEFKQMKEDFNRQKEDFKKSKDDFQATREKLLTENVALKRELELRFC